MKGNKITRRHFLQAVGIVGAVSAWPVFASNTTLGKKPGNIKILDDDYVIVGGWVLLKSDLDLI